LAIGQQAATAPAPPNTKIEGMPPIPQSILDGIAKYAQFRQALFAEWHPPKRQVLINTSFASNPQIPQLHLVEGPGRDRRQVTWMPRGVSVNAAVTFAPSIVTTRSCHWPSAS